GEVNAALSARDAVVLVAEEQARLSAETVDVTALPDRQRHGARHPLSMLMERIGDVFIGMGSAIAEGPELANDCFKFDALNVDPDHPARSEQDTSWVDPSEQHLVLRTQTSPVQIRSLLSRQLAVYDVSPGRVFRTDDLEATHPPVFH